MLRSNVFMTVLAVLAMTVASRSAVGAGYEYDADAGHVPPGGGVLGDPGNTKLTDGIADGINWISSPQWAGVQDPTFVPGDLAGDSGLPQPRLNFDFGTSSPLDSLEITYLVDADAKIHAPDSVTVSFSNGGSPFGGNIVSTGFDNSLDNLPTSGDGAIRILTIPLGGVVADSLRLDFLNDFEWTALGEINVVGAPEPPLTFGYVYGDAGHLPPAGGVLGDPSLTKLTDGIADGINWINSPQWVGIQDPAFIPGDLSGDTQLPQPRIVFTLAESTPLASVEITYLVDHDAKIDAPDAVTVSFSDGGSAFGGEIVSLDFDGSPDNLPNSADGAIRTLTIDLGGVTADSVQLDFLNDFEWTALGEIKFNAVVIPEPSTFLLAVCGGIGMMLIRRRDQRRRVSN